jgi:hypothetical protein
LKTKTKPKAKTKPQPVFSKKSLLPNLDDMLIGQPSGRRESKPKTNSNIFPNEMASRMQDLMAGGLKGFKNTFKHMSVANMSGTSALPNMGDSAFLKGSGIDSGLSFQGAQAGALGMAPGIKAALDVQGSANVTTLTPFMHTPGNAQDAYNLPKSYVEQIRWSRLMYNLNPYIHAITDLKAYYPYSKFKLTTPEPWVTQFYESVAFNKTFNLYRFILRMSLSLKKFGEAVVWGARKQDGIWPQTGQPRWVWDYFILLEPELVEIKKSIIGSSEPQYFLRPNRDFEDLVKRIRSGDREVAHLKDKIAEPIMKKIERRELVPMDASTVSSIQYLTDGSATRGTPPYQCLFVNFIFEDFVRLALMAQANRYHFPIELWLLGNLEKGIMPSVADLQNLRDLVNAAIENPPFSIFFPPILDYKAVGVQGSLMNIKDDMEYAHKQYLIGMGVNENMILGDSGIFSSNETAGNQTFIRMMQKDRDEMEEWMRWHFFEPLAQWNNLKMNKNGILCPIIPDIEWEKTLDFKAEEDEAGKLEKAWDLGLLDPDTMITAWLKRNPEEIAIKMQKAAGGPFDIDGKFSRATQGGGKAPSAGAGGGAGGGGGGGGGAPAQPAPGAGVEAPGGTEAPTAPKAGGAKAPEAGGGAAEETPAGAPAPAGA